MKFISFLKARLLLSLTDGRVITALGGLLSAIVASQGGEVSADWAKWAAAAAAGYLVGVVSKQPAAVVEAEAPAPEVGR